MLKSDIRGLSGDSRAMKAYQQNLAVGKLFSHSSYVASVRELCEENL